MGSEEGDLRIGLWRTHFPTSRPPLANNYENKKN